MAEVVGLRGDEYVEPQFDQGVLSIIEDIYKQARDGKVVGVAVVLVIDEPGSSDYSLSCSWHGPKMILMGGVTRLSHRINTSLDESHE